VGDSKQEWGAQQRYERAFPDSTQSVGRVLLLQRNGDLVHRATNLPSIGMW
jgi:hypothetical protein